MKVLFFGPNGSGKGTQGAIVKEKLDIPHIETGVIFRENISQGTDLGKEAKGYIDRGELVPDSITQYSATPSRASPPNRRTGTQGIGWRARCGKVC